MSGTLKLCNITQKELAERMGVSQSYVANKLRLLSLSSHLEKLIVKHGISERHARALLRLESEEDRLEILEKIISRDLTVRECEALVDIKVDTYAPTVIARAESAERIEAFTETLKRSLVTLRFSTASRSPTQQATTVTKCTSPYALPTCEGSDGCHFPLLSAVFEHSLMHIDGRK